MLARGEMDGRERILRYFRAQERGCLDTSGCTFYFVVEKLGT